MECCRTLICLLLLSFLCCFLLVDAVLYDRNYAEQMKEHWYSSRSWHNAKMCDKDSHYFEKLYLRRKFSSNTFGNLRVRAGLPDPSKRREYRCMSRNERKGLHNALNMMKSTKVANEGYSEYDNFVIRHDSQHAPAAHWGPAFLPWHREFLLGMERGIQVYCPSCMLPYWDNRLDSRLRDLHAGSVLFSDYLIGNLEGPVTTGFAANWQQQGDYCKNNIGSILRRNVADNAGTLFSDNDTSYYLVPKYENICYPWNSFLEETHGSVHMYFGRNSSMGVTSCSPNDPIFFFHHSFIDLLFENHRNFTKRMKQRFIYPPVQGNIPDAVIDVNSLLLHEGDKVKAPFLTTNDEGLYNNDYTKLYYRYETPPGDVEFCRKDRDCCGSVTPDYIWCNKRTGQCVSKLREGARSSPSFPDNACYCLPPKVPKKINNYCSCINAQS